MCFLNGSANKNHNQIEIVKSNQTACQPNLKSELIPASRQNSKAHGGTIWVESSGCDEEKCPGSTFHILIPARTEPTDPKVAKLFGKLEKAKPEPDGQENPPADTSAA